MQFQFVSEQQQYSKPAFLKICCCTPHAWKCNNAIVAKITGDRSALEDESAATERLKFMHEGFSFST